MTFPQVVAKNAAYRSSWHGLLAEVPAGDREAGFMRSLAGPATLMLVVRYDGRSYVTGTICELRNCAANDVVALIVPETGRMYAVQRRRGDVPLRYRFLGHPDAAMQGILVDQAERADRHRAELLR
ncbi:Ivy family c-type lysozyme inhibitor [Methylobacterium fujisawaense]|uniref:Ivy family c-type lysozyme inhibitor n=1 Tax=Methylobacterium fujisawaense TaxID=107400 RepID=UPI0031F56C56